MHRTERLATLRVGPTAAGFLRGSCREGGQRRVDRKPFPDILFVMRQVVIYPGEDGYWVAECPSLPGCVSQGRSKEEAVANIREAVVAYIETLEEDKLPVPVR